LILQSRSLAVLVACSVVSGAGATVSVSDQSAASVRTRLRAAHYRIAWFEPNKKTGNYIIGAEKDGNAYTASRSATGARASELAHTSNSYGSCCAKAIGRYLYVTGRGHWGSPSPGTKKHLLVFITDARGKS
jgi:hypothetical protein